jgi:uncharacterized membrane protein YgcG
MGIFIILGVLGILGYYFLLRKPFRGEKPSGIADELNEPTIRPYIGINSNVHRRCALIMDNINLTHYNNGEVASLMINLDVDWYQPGDIVTIGDRLDLFIVSNARKLRNHFYYIAAPLQQLTDKDFNFVKLGSKVYRLSRNMTPAENSYFLKNKMDVEAAAFKFKDFNPPYKPHKVGGKVSSTSNNSNSSNDTINDMLYNPLLSPYSPISVWNSGDDSVSSSSSSSWSSSDNDSSSSYDSGSSDSGGGDCGGD